MRFPDFIPAKREEVPDYVRAEYLQSQADATAAAEARLRKQERAANIQAMGAGAMNVASLDIGDGKTPIGEIIRMGKEKWGGGSAAAQNPAAPGPGGISQGPAPVNSALPQGRGMQGGSPMPPQAPPAPQSAVANAVRGGGGAVTPTAAVPGEEILKGTNIDMGKVLGGGPLESQVPKPPPTPASTGGWRGGLNIPTGGPQAATKVPIDKMIDMQMSGIGSNVPINATAQVGKGAGEAVSANIASKGAGDVIGKGLGGAAASGIGASVPVAGAAMGAIPAALRGDTMGAVKGGVGGAASSTLMAAAPAMAAAGPVGWAGMAGLAALSLYGMLG